MGAPTADSSALHLTTEKKDPEAKGQGEKGYRKSSTHTIYVERHPS